jgi:TolA-binding protein
MSHRQQTFALPLLLSMSCALIAGGCASFGSANKSDADLPSAYATGAKARQDDKEDEAEGLSWSDFKFEKIGTTAKKLTGQGTNRELAKATYGEAEDLFNQARRAEGEQKVKLFEQAAPKFITAANRWSDSQLAMDAMFMAGESYYFADNYDQANLTYEKLVKAFPNNRYQDQIDQRRFAIARYWLELDRQNPESFYYVNWFNKERPVRDARGNGLRVFSKISIDDPTGRLADDAVLAAGNEHFSSGDFYKADEKYTDLRKAYPSSEHQFLAHFLGLKAKLECYQGPAYGGTALDEAEKLIKQIRRQFPQEAQKEREYLDRAAAEVRFKKAERLMFIGQYYDHRSEFRAAQHYYAQVVQDFPDTPLAKTADERITQVAGLPPVPAKQLPWLIALFPESDKVKPLIEATKRLEEEEAAQLAAQPPAEANPVQPASMQR